MLTYMKLKLELSNRIRYYRKHYKKLILENKNGTISNLDTISLTTQLNEENRVNHVYLSSFKYGTIKAFQETINELDKIDYDKYNFIKIESFIDNNINILTNENKEYFNKIEHLEQDKYLRQYKKYWKKSAKIQGFYEIKYFIESKK